MALVEEAIAISNDGTKVDQVAVAMCAIADESNQVKMLVDELNVGSQQQARRIEQIAKAIIQMQQVTQKSAASAEKCASAAEELNAESVSVHGIMERLTAMVSSG